MRFDFDFYSSLLLVFFIHTLVYSVLFFYRYKKKEQQFSLWMSIFLFLAALYIAPWMLGFAGWYGHQPYRDILFYVPFQHLLLIGPVIFFYVCSLFNPKFRLSRKAWLHFLPALLYMAFCVVMVVYDKLIVKHYYFLKKEQDPDFDNWYQVIGYISMIVYFGASLSYYYRYKIAVEAIVSNAADFLFTWVRNFLVAFVIILLAWFCVALFGLFYDLNFTISWWYFLAFAISCYYIAIAGYSNAVESKLFFKSSFFRKDNKIYLSYDMRPKLSYHPEGFEEIEIAGDHSAGQPVSAELSQWKIQLETLLQEQRIYLEPELSLFDVAKMLDTNISFLSLIINKTFRVNFNDLVNGYRVRHFIELLKNKAHENQTLLSLAYESGFNSKTTFNRAFKKIKGVSPQAFIKKMHGK